jgi:DNA-binding MarR family transcriptional regulator
MTAHLDTPHPETGDRDPAPRDAVGAEPVPAEITRLQECFVSLVRAFNRARARIVAEAERDVEWSAHVLLKCIANNGEPMRAAELAGTLHSDPSTVSRQVAALVKDGYLERRADPADGRASLLALTPAAHGLLAEHDRIRAEHLGTVLQDWSDADIKQFAALLERFTTDYESTTTDWIAEQIARRSRRAGSKD